MLGRGIKEGQTNHNVSMAGVLDQVFLSDVDLDDQDEILLCASVIKDVDNNNKNNSMTFTDQLRMMSA